ncbi:lasso peptide biosynthesis B2 protein [Flavobacterium sp. WC2429]|uniref:Lasso peptide biosynthesis B2 protein n=2 Tax=unclassified Flavobacterium TaxID=196869 RepID=A0AB39WFF4_9FLAO
MLLWGSKKGFSEHICKNQKVNVVLTPEKITLAKDIIIAIHIVNNYLPWKNVCRHQSWQAVYLLLKYQVQFEYTVGIHKTKNIKEAHSWVKVNSKFICGRCNEKNYFIL